ncbi:hypothetical protein ACFOZ7_17665 [Natribaculum luteum]|uniref:Uncharacterized protein n=1 Tax=Natribaculum luteum TaxID=1586232 RepID=A0ABD5P350_9EURY|nr:hypothetical protein [Natribaculum luteum]
MIDHLQPAVGTACAVASVGNTAIDQNHHPTMTNNQELHDHEWVESAWKERLRRAGIDESTARKLAAWYQSDPALTTGNASPATVRDVVEQTIDRTSLASHGVDDPGAVRQDLRRALAAGLNGRLEGPVALLSPSTARQYGVSGSDESATGTTGRRTITLDGTGTELGDPRSTRSRSAGSRVQTEPLPSDRRVSRDHLRTEVVDAVRWDLHQTVDSRPVTRADLVVAVSILTGAFGKDDVEPPVSGLVDDFERLVARGIRVEELIRAIKMVE